MNGGHEPEQLPHHPTVSSSSCAPGLLCSAMRAQGQWRRRLLLMAFMFVGVTGGPESDALDAFRQSLTDNSNVLQSWDTSYVNACGWFHVTCNSEFNVVRLDLQNSGLSGPLVPQLGVLSKLQYMEFSGNNFSGPIPKELGNLSSLVSLDLYQNNLSGTIPDTLGQLKNLRFFRANNNSLSGSIPPSLTTITRLEVLDLSYNDLSGEIPNNGSFSFFTPISFMGNNKLCGSLIGKQCPQSAYPPTTPLPLHPPPGPNGQQSMNLQGKQIVQIILLALILLCLLSWDSTMIEQG